MINTPSFYSPIVFITNALLPLRFVSPSSLNLFNNSIDGAPVKKKKKPKTTRPAI
jgi:hypothetical protein